MSSIDSEVTIHEVTVEEGHLLFDRAVMEDLGLSGSEFIERLETNQLHDYSEEDLARVVLLLPFAA